MTDVLSQNEIDALLQSMISDGDSSAASVQNTNNTFDQKKVRIYDFKRPSKFSKEQIRTIRSMHETFSRSATSALLAQLRKPVHVHVATVEEMTYEEFIRSIPNPTTIAVINMDPLQGSAILEIDPTITFTIIDRLFGGKGDSGQKSRELTEIEQQVMEGVIVRLLTLLRDAWSQAIDLRPRLGQIEVNPQFAQIVPPNDMVVLITIEIAIDEIEGMINFCVPYLVIEPIASKLSTEYWYTSIRKAGTTEHITAIKEQLYETKIDIVAELGTNILSVQELLSLKEGDILNLPHAKTEESLILKVGKEAKFKWKPGIVGKQYAAQVIEKIDSAHALTLEELIEEGEE